MSTPEQLQQNIGYMQNAHPGMLSDEERKVLDQAKAALDSRAAIPCTGCNYCVDMCPNKIAIPYNFRAYNMGTLYDDMELAKDFYQNEVTSYGRRADSCTSCDRAKRFARSTLLSASGFRKSTNCWESKDGHRFPA